MAQIHPQILVRSHYCIRKLASGAFWKRAAKGVDSSVKILRAEPG
jgi:hypothetical protein